jgi:hypothetical protein
LTGKIDEKRAIAPRILPLSEKKRPKQTHRCRQTGKYCYCLANSAKTQECLSQNAPIRSESRFIKT